MGLRAAGGGPAWNGATEGSAAAPRPHSAAATLGQVPRFLAAERATDADPHGEGDPMYDVAQAWTAAGRRRLGLGGSHNDA